MCLPPFKRLYRCRKNGDCDGKGKYNIYSCSKLITCVAALQLWEKGLFSLDDKLNKYMPEFEHMSVKKDGEIVPAKNPILIRHLFTMTAGFSYDLAYPQILLCQKETKGECTTRELIRYLAKEPLEFEPAKNGNTAFAMIFLRHLLRY